MGINKATIGVIGLGSIGYTTMLNYARENQQVVGYDIDPKKVTDVNRGKVDIPGIEDWVESSIDKIASTNAIAATNDWDEFWRHESSVIFIAVPTEKKGIPSNDIIASLFTQIAFKLSESGSYKPTIIIESTMTPGTSDKIILPIFEACSLHPGKDFYMGVSPRRDWFGCGGKSVKTMERVYAGVTLECEEKVRDALSVICRSLFKASSHKVAELTKCVENTFRFIEISLANQFALAFPEINIIEVLTLAATKWNMEKYTPSLRVGGHCVPVASRYVLNGSLFPESLSIVKAALFSEEDVLVRLCGFLIRNEIKNVLILGLSYHGNLKVSVFSAASSLIPKLNLHGIRCSIADPLYSAAEIKDITGVGAIEIGDNIEEFDAVVLSAGHNQFENDGAIAWIESGKNLRVIIDNSNLWQGVNWGNITYIQVGDGKGFDGLVNYYKIKI